MYTTHVHNFHKSEPREENRKHQYRREKISLLQLINKNFNLLKFFNSLEFDNNKFDLFTPEFVIEIVTIYWDKWKNSTNSNSKDSEDDNSKDSEYDIEGISNLFGIELPSTLEIGIQGAKSLGAIFINVLMRAVDIKFRTLPRKFQNNSDDNFKLEGTFLGLPIWLSITGQCCWIRRNNKNKKKQTNG